MASNFPGPFEVELRYTCSGEQHTQRLNCDTQSAPTPGDAPSTILLDKRDAGTIALDTALTNWITLVKPFYHTGVTFDDYTFWQYAPGTFDRTFITTASLGIAGTNALAVNLSFQNIMTMRTLEGGLMKLSFMETSATDIQRLSYAASGAVVKAIFDFVIGSTNWILARDTSFPIATIASMGGGNEALFKKRNR